MDPVPSSAVMPLVCHRIGRAARSWDGRTRSLRSLCEFWPVAAGDLVVVKKAV
jgi:hypothetical protein